MTGFVQKILVQLDLEECPVCAADLSSIPAFVGAAGRKVDRLGLQPLAHQAIPGGQTGGGLGSGFRRVDGGGGANAAPKNTSLVSDTVPAHKVSHRY